MDEKVKSLSEIMAPVEEYPTVREDDSVNDAIVALRQYLAGHRGHRSLLVTRTTDSGCERVVGILTVSEIMETVKNMTRHYDFDEVSRMAHTLDGFSRKARIYREQLLKEGFEKTVKEIISEKCLVTIDIDCTCSDAAKLMLIKNVQAVPVRSGGCVVGVIRAIDILEYISGFLAP